MSYTGLKVTITRTTAAQLNNPNLI